MTAPIVHHVIRRQMSAVELPIDETGRVTWPTNAILRRGAIEGQLWSRLAEVATAENLKVTQGSLLASRIDRARQRRGSELVLSGRVYIGVPEPEHRRRARVRPEPPASRHVVAEGRVIRGRHPLHVRTSVDRRVVSIAKLVDPLAGT